MTHMSVYPVCRRCALPAILLFVSLLACPPSATADLVELLSGAKVEGKVTSIDKAAKEITFTRTIGGRSYSRIYPYSKIHAVTLGTKRYVLNEKTDGSSGADSSSSRATGTRTGSGSRRA